MNAVTPQAIYEVEICTAAKRGMADAGFTYETLATALGENLHTVWNWFNGRTLFPAKALPALAILGIKAPLCKAASLCQHNATPTSKFLRTKHPVKPIRAHALDLVGDLHRVTAEVNAALADDSRIDAHEEAQIAEAGNKLIEQVTLLMHRVAESRAK